MGEDLTKRREDTMERWHRLLERKGPELMLEYNVQCEKYDGDATNVTWEGPRLAVEHVKKYVPDQSVTILDVCGGTGEVGLRLKDAGYSTVDVLDGSTGMLMVSMRQQIYRNYYRELLGETADDPPTNLRSNVYDVVIMSGGHVSPGKFSEMTRMVKSGGFCITSVFHAEGDFEGSMALLKELEKAGKVKLEEQEDVEHISFDDKGNDYPGHRAVWRKL